MKKKSLFAIYLLIHTSILFGQYGFETGIPVTGIKVIKDFNELQNKDLNTSKVNSQVKTTMERQMNKGTAIQGSQPTQVNIERQYQTSNVLLNFPYLFTQNSICSVLDPEVRSTLSHVLRAIILSNISRALPRDFGIHSSSNFQLGNGCNVDGKYVNLAGNSFVEIQVIIPQNRLFTRITTSDGIPGELDPNFIVFFDMVVKVQLPLPKDTRSLTRFLNPGTVVVEAKNISRPETRSITGNLAILLNDLSSYLGGRDVIAELRKDQSFTYLIGKVTELMDFDSVKKNLDQLPSMRIENSVDGSVLILKATNAPSKAPVVK